MSISIEINPTRAVSALDRFVNQVKAIEPAFTDDARVYAEKVKKTLDLAVSDMTTDIYAYLIRETPKFSNFLVSNWRLQSGSQPNLSLLPFPPSRLPGEYSIPGPVLFGKIPGTEPQYLYNRTSYARDAALSGRPLNTAPPDWFTNVGQTVESGVTFRNYLRQAIAKTRTT